MLAMLRRESAIIHEKMRMLEIIPDDDNYPDKTMIRVVVARPMGGHRSLTYLLLKVIDSAHGTKWYFTGGTSRQSSSRNERWVTWDQLQSWLGGMGIESWDELVTVESQSQRGRIDDERPPGSY